MALWFSGPRCDAPAEEHIKSWKKDIRKLKKEGKHALMVGGAASWEGSLQALRWFASHGYQIEAEEGNWIRIRW